MDETKNEPGASWIHLPIYRSLTEYILFLDVPRSCIIWNVGAALLILLTFGLSYWYLLSINLIVHFGVRYFSVEDPQCLEGFSRYWTKRDYYST